MSMKQNARLWQIYCTAADLVTTKLGDNRHTITDSRRTVPQAAELSGIGTRTLHRVLKIRRNACSELLQAVTQGAIAVTEAATIASLCYEDQLDALDDALTREDRPTRTALYRHYDTDGHLLYVGISFHPYARGKHHARTSPWIDQASYFIGEWFDTWEDAKRAESKAIIKERPLHNVQEALPEGRASL
jgi:hypothetical protein